MSDSNELIVIESENALAVFTAPSGLDPYIEQIRAEVRSFVPDVSTKKGRDAIASIAYKVAKSKTALDNAGKSLVDRLKEQPKLVDAERKRMREELDALKDEVRKPLTDWEEAEKARVDAHELAIDRLRNLDDMVSELTAEQIAARIADAESAELGAKWEEFEGEAAIVKNDVLARLGAALEKRQKYEAEQAELERLRAEAAAREAKEREERIAREAAEAARIVAENKARLEAEEIQRKAQAERAAQERRELELKLAAEKAEREAAEAKLRAEQAEAQAKANAERQQAEARAREEAEAAAREKDKKHKAAINNAALDAFIAGGMTEDAAKLAITLIAKRTIPNVTISY
jgi:chromosome segregation ATPase